MRPLRAFALLASLSLGAAPAVPASAAGPPPAAPERTRDGSAEVAAEPHPDALPSPSARLRQAPASLPSQGPPGSNLQVYVMTMGQGDLVWERFGHNALGVRDTVTGSDVVYNWGTFSFEQPGFIGRFLRGEMLYWMAPNDAVLTALAYRQANRSVTIQELNLTPAQRLEVQRFVLWNQQEENKFYRYDYYRDNCSTRVRDAIDRVIGGAIARATSQQVTSMSYRDHSLRLMDGMFWTRTGIDIGLGRPTDRPITAWEAMFIPMEVQRRIRDIRVPDDAGRLVPLVASEREIVSSSRPPERMSPPSEVAGFLVAGLLLAGALLALGFRLRGTATVRTVAVIWSLLAGVLGLLLVLLWVATEHVAAHQNQNLFFMNPVWLVVAATVPFVYRARRVREVAAIAIRACALLTLVGAVLAITPWGQPTGAIAAFVAPVNLALYVLVLRVIYLAIPPAPTAPAASTTAPAAARA